MSFVPTTYEDWKHCITVKCEALLTANYVEERIATLGNDHHYETQKFVERWVGQGASCSHIGMVQTGRR